MTSVILTFIGYVCVLTAFPNEKMSNKGALALLNDYGGDSSDDEVPGCRFSTKRMHRDDEDEPKSKRLPAPQFAIANAEYVEDPELHEKRVRSFPHERGNWATFVYIPFESNEGIDKLAVTIGNLLSPEIELKLVEDLHLSVTRTVILKHHWIESFIDTVKRNIASIHRFIIMFSSLNVYCNEEQTRTFIGLEIQTGYDTLLRLVSFLDGSLKEFNLPKFYENPSFHVSLLWCLGNQVEQLQAVLPKLNQCLQELMAETPQECWYNYVETVRCKTGNKTFEFELV